MQRAGCSRAPSLRPVRRRRRRVVEVVLYDGCQPRRAHPPSRRLTNARGRSAEAEAGQTDERLIVFDDLDEAAALEAQKQAQQAMLNQSADVDYSRAAAQLAAATAQLRTLQQIRKAMGK